MEPVTDQATASLPQSVNGHGFILPLAARIVEVPLEPDNLIPTLLQKASALYQMSSPPSSTKECRDCQSLADMFRALQS